MLLIIENAYKYSIRDWWIRVDSTFFFCLQWRISNAKYTKEFTTFINFRIYIANHIFILLDQCSPQCDLQ